MSKLDELNERLLIALGLPRETAQLVIGELARLRERVAELEKELEILCFAEKRDAKEAQEIADALGIGKEDWLYLHDFIRPITAEREANAALRQNFTDAVDARTRAMGENSALRQQVEACRGALERMVAAEDASRDKFTAKEIDEIEAAMDQARAALSAIGLGAGRKG